MSERLSLFDGLVALLKRISQVFGAKKNFGVVGYIGPTYPICSQNIHKLALSSKLKQYQVNSPMHNPN